MSMATLEILSISLGVLLVCAATVVAAGGRRAVALCGYASALFSFNNALTTVRAADWERLPLIVAATVLLGAGATLAVAGRGAKRRLRVLTDSAAAGEPEDEIPASHRSKEA